MRVSPPCAWAWTVITKTCSTANCRDAIVCRCGCSAGSRWRCPWASAEVWGWSYGTVEWIGILSIAGLLLIWFLTFRPRAAPTAGGCALAAPVLAVV